MALKKLLFRGHREGFKKGNIFPTKIELPIMDLALKRSFPYTLKTIVDNCDPRPKEVLITYPTPSMIQEEKDLPVSEDLKYLKV